MAASWLCRLLVILCFAHPARLAAEAPASRVITAYALTPDGPPVMPSEPAAWTFLASNDGQSWKELDTQKEQRFKPGQRRVFFIENREAYRIYRLQINANAAGEPHGTSLAELELNGPVVRAGPGPDPQAIITSSREHPLVGAAWNAFDGDTGSKWVDFGQFKNGGCWIQCEYVADSGLLLKNINQLKIFTRLTAASTLLAEKLPEIISKLSVSEPARSLTGYAITSANDDPDRDPRDWQLLGSSDGGKRWETLDTRQNEIFSTRFQRRVFMLAKPAGCALYRLQIEGKPNGAYAMQLAELEPIYATTLRPDRRFSLIVSAESENPPMERTEMAFDGDFSSKWLAFHAPQSRSHWIQWQSLPAVEGLPLINLRQLTHLMKSSADRSFQIGKLSRTLLGYALVSAGDAPERDPRDWRLLGSNDGGVTWETLDLRSGELFKGRLEKREFTLKKPAPYALIRFQTDSVRDPATANAVQLAGLLPQYAPNPGEAEFSTVIWAEGDHPPDEGVENIFDGDLKNKWLHFSKNPNCASWIQWFFTTADKRPVVRADAGPVSQPAMPRAIQLQIEGVAIAADGASLYFLDESGFQTFQLEPPIAVPTGQRIRLSGQVRFDGDHPHIVNPEVSSGAALEEFSVVSGEPYPESESLLACTMEGKVTAFSNGPIYSTVQMELRGGHRVKVKILNNKNGPQPAFSNCQLCVRGIAEPVFNGKGIRVAGIIWVASLDDVLLLPPPEGQWNQWEQYPSRNPLEKIQEGELVRMTGTVRQQDASQHLIVEVGSDQIVVYTDKMLPPGSIVEAAGFLIREGPTTTLRPGFARLPIERPRPVQPPIVYDENHPVTEIRQIHEVMRSQPDRPFAVKVRGVITYIDLGLSEWYLQDGADSIVIQDQLAAGLSPSLQQEGMYVEVQGRVWAKRWAGVAPASFVSVLGRGQMPEPIRHSWDHLMTGRDEGRWVQVDGIVTAFEKQRLTLNVSGGQIIAWVNEIDPGVQNRLLGSIVRVSGVCRAVRNGRGQQLGVRLLVPSAEQVEILKASPGNPFDVPMLPVGSIMRVQARNIGFTIQLVKTAGVVTHKNMRQLFVQDGADAVRVVTREDSSVQPGDQVEVVGLAEADGLSPKLVQAWVRKTGQSALPAMHPIDLQHMDSSVAGITQDSTLGSIEATYLGRSANEFLQILELQDGKEKNPFYAYLPLAQEGPFELPIGSRVRLRGVFKAKIDTVPDFGQVVTAFEMYLNSPADITVLQRPPWWTTRHTLWSGSALGSILLGALAWAGLLRKQVRRRTCELDAKIIEQQQTEWELQAQIAEGKQMEIEIEKTHQELLDASRQAGMAEIATNVLHNVGNVLNSVNISCSVIEVTLRKSNIGSVAKVAELLVKNSGNLPDFFSGDPIGRKLPDFFGKLAARLEGERTAVLGEVDSLGRNIEHIKAIVAFQQNYAKGFRVGESLPLADVVEHALKINAEALTRARIEVVRDFQSVPPVTVERHKVLQILVNLIRNANHALTDADQAGSRKLFVRVVGENDRVFVTVRDNGIGIPLENLTRIFAHGFTTRKEGHGFGLHSGVLAASEMGGRLTVESGGPGKGAAFTLELPIHFEATLPRPSEGEAARRAIHCTGV